MSNEQRTTYSWPTNLYSVPDIHPETNRDFFTNHGQVPLYLYPHFSKYAADELIAVANAIVNPRGKGVYATDEAPYLMDTLLQAKKEHTEVRLSDQQMRAEIEGGHEKANAALRKEWKEFAYESIPSEYISGVILHEETLLDFKLEPVLSAKGIIAGVRANGELAPIPRHQEIEFMVEGLDGLLTRLQAARGAGARFSKWRVPIACGLKETGLLPESADSLKTTGLPSQLSLEIQAETLAKYAAISQQAGLVPIVEPDVDFSRDADLARSTEVHEKAISLIYEKMRMYGVLLEGSLIKPSFPQPGLKHPSRSTITPEEIALATATVISRTVPGAVPGVLFLSGGLPPDVATSWLAALNKLVSSAPSHSPFARLPALTFSYGRAIQGQALEEWGKGNKEGTKSALVKWSKACWEAAKGGK